jgi:DNA-directed RNA polymerase subunit RPC12/RpoP
MGRRKHENKQAKFVCEDCGNEFFVPSSLFDVIGVLCDRCGSDKTHFLEIIEVGKDMSVSVVEEVIERKSFTDPEVLSEGSLYYWISPNFKGSYKLVELVRLLDEEFCEVRLENEVFKTRRTNLKIEKIEV